MSGISVTLDVKLHIVIGSIHKLRDRREAGVNKISPWGHTHADRMLLYWKYAVFKGISDVFHWVSLRVDMPAAALKP